MLSEHVFSLFFHKKITSNKGKQIIITSTWVRIMNVRAKGACSLVVTVTLVLSCMHQPIQPKSVGNSLILQHSPSRAGSPSRIRGILEWAVIILINAPASIQTRDLWLWYHIELHAPTSSTQKLKLIGKGGQFTYTPTLSSNPGLGKKRSLLIPLLGMGDWWVGPRLVCCWASKHGSRPEP
jgi:hypothetical protein